MININSKLKTVVFLIIATLLALLNYFIIGLYSFIPLFVLVIAIYLYLKNSLDRILLRNIILAGMIFYGLYTYYSLPIIALYFIIDVMWFERRIDINLLAKDSYSWFGPIAIDRIKTYIAFIPLAFVSYRVLVLIATGISILIAIVLYNHVMLSNSLIKGIRFKKEVYVGDRSSINIDLRTPNNSLILAIYGDRYYLYRSRGYGTISIPMDSSMVGRFTSRLLIYVFDARGIARFELLNRNISYTIKPSYQKILAKMSSRSKFFYKHLVIEPFVKTRLYFLEYSQGEVEAVSYKGFREILTKREGLLAQIIRGLMSLENIEFEGMLGKLGRKYGSGHLRASMTGEYRGIRQYVPGDKLKNIHWKKTITYNRLMIKEYASGGTIQVKSTVKKIGLVLVVDITSMNLYELNEILSSFFQLISRLTGDNPLMKILVFVIEADTMLSLEGNAITIAELLGKAVMRSKLFSYISYVPIGHNPSHKEIKELIKWKDKNLLVRFIIQQSFNFAISFMKLLVKNNVLPPRNIIIVSGKLTAFRTGVLHYYLSENGYSVNLILPYQMEVMKK